MSLKLEVSTAPSLLPVTPTESKLRLGIDHAELDTWLEQKTLEAIAKVEAHSGKALMSQGLKLRLNGWPCSGIIHLPKPPLISVTSVVYTDTAGASQTLSASLYTVNAYEEPGTLRPAYQEQWPSLRGVPNNVVITYVAGHAANTDAPLRPARQAIFDLLQLWHTYRDPVLLFGQAQPLAAIEAGVLAGALDGSFRCYHEFQEESA